MTQFGDTEAFLLNLDRVSPWDQGAEDEPAIGSGVRAAGPGRAYNCYLGALYNRIGLVFNDTAQAPSNCCFLSEEGQSEQNDERRKNNF